MKCPLCDHDLEPGDEVSRCTNNGCIFFMEPFLDTYWVDMEAQLKERDKRTIERYKQEITAKVAIAERPGWTQHVNTWMWNENTKVRIGTDHIKRRFTVQIPLGGEKILRAYDFETPDAAMEFAEKAMELVKGATK